jgi:phospholipid/cholesterol/gamma-HCH transport system substrate-binding protein/paraquat-inducible protein B
MEEGKRYYRLGAFVLLTLGILLAILFVLGGRSLFRPTFTFETYFKDSVAGLDIGSPVRFRGVPLGQVIEIRTSSAVYEKDVPPDKRRNYIVVRAKVSISGEEAAAMERDVKEYVRQGVRAQTELVGVTGQQYLALDFHDPQKSPSLPFDWTPDYDYVPSIPSFAAQIVANVQTFLANLNEAQIKSISDNLNTLLVKANTQLDKLQVERLSADADGVLTDARATIARMDQILAHAHIDETLRRIDSASAKVDKLLAAPGLERTIDNAGVITDRIRKLVDSGDVDRMATRIADVADRLDALVGANQYDITATVGDLRSTAQNLRELSESVKRYPAGALVGGPPEKIVLPGSSK